MKSTQKFRSTAEGFGADDLLKKPAKLEPIKKSGKEKRTIYSALQDDDDDELLTLHKRESILDYFDDVDEEDQR